MKLLGSGTNNEVYQAYDGFKNYAFRISKRNLDKSDIHNTLQESELTIRLSGLGITPKIHDIYFAIKKQNFRGKSKLATVLVVVSDLAICDVEKFIESHNYKYLNKSQIEELADQTIPWSTACFKRRYDRRVPERCRRQSCLGRCPKHDKKAEETETAPKTNLQEA